MIHQISILLSPLLDEITTRTSADFRGLRAANPGTMDVVYDDFTMSKDNASETLSQVNLAAMRFSSKFAAHIQKETCTPEEILYVLEISNKHSDCERIRAFLKEFLISSVLIWWYSSRNATLADREANAAMDAMDRLSSQIIASACTRRLRWF